MAIRREVYTYDDEADGFLPVLARATEPFAGKYAIIDHTFTTGKEGAIRKLVKVFRPGYFAGSISGSKKARILPRTYTVGAVAVNATALVVKDAGIFVVGGVLSIIPPSARVNIGSTGAGWAAADTITVTINGIAVVYTVIAGDIGGNLAATNTNIATKVLAAIKTHPYLGTLISGLNVLGTGSSTDIVLWATDFLGLYSLTAADTGTNGTATASAATFGINTTIGTISAVNPATNTLTISAAAVSVPDGMPVGVAGSSPIDLGMLSPNQAIDLLYRESDHFALYREAFVYRDRLPYWDGELARLFPEIKLV